ncbi:MAG: SIS domain-containing protein, partial [Rhodospirillales bacterium]
KVLSLEAAAVSDLIDRLDSRFTEAVELLYACRGRIVVTGLGKSGIICRKIAATLASTGTPALFMHPAEAVHGDLGMVVPGDVAVAVSNSGETAELLQLLERIKRLGVKLLAMTGNPASTLATQSDIHLDIGVRQEACPMDLVPTASTTASLALGDALAVTLAQKRGFREADFASLHPAGRLGRKVLTARQAMHQGDAMPAVSFDTPIKDAIYEMSAKRLGMTTVLDQEGKLLGLITDGDLRRLMESVANPLQSRSGDIMTRSPVTIGSDDLATAALHLMESRKITSLVVVDEAARALGVVHLHDLWRTQLI